MLKPVVFAVSMLLGGAAVMFTVSAQHRPNTRTNQPTPMLERTTEPLVRVQSALPAQADELVMEMDEVSISAAPRAVRRAAKPKEPIGYQPCSEWRDLGPKALADSLTADQHRVRALCPQP
jgi:hypothetical protein